MRQLIGKDVGSYVFDKTAKTITFSGVPLTQEQLSIITNTTSQAIIYSFAHTALGGTLVGSVLTLTYDTSAMSNTDKLQIYVDIPNVVPALPSGASTEDTLKELASLTRLLKRVIQNPNWLNIPNNALQVLTMANSVITTVSTVSAVTVVTGLTNIGGQSADQMMINDTHMRWALTKRNLYS
jgi:hypothetical protein